MKLLVIFTCLFLLSDLSIADDELPLDAWIIKKSPKEEAVPETAVDSVEEADESGDQEERESRRIDLIEEERRVYKALLEGYDSGEDDGKEKRIPTASKVFSKAVLSKVEQKRIEKAKEVQRRVRLEQAQKARRMIRTEEVVPHSARLCLASFSGLGFPEDTARVSSQSAESVNKTWHSFFREMVKKNCDFMVMTGLVSRTKTRANEFMQKSVSFIRRFGNRDLKYKVSTSEGMGFYGFLYDPAVFQLTESDEVQSVILRRGGMFSEQHFSSSPYELVLEDTRADVPYTLRFFIFDFRNFRKVKNLPDIPHMLQMASALNELAARRVRQGSGEALLLFGSTWQPVESPVYPVLSGQLALDDFLSDAACRILSDDEKKEEERDYLCDESVLERKPQTIFGSLTDLAPGIPEASRDKKTKSKKNLAKSTPTSDIFIHVTGLGVRKDKSRDGENPVGLVQIGTRKYPAYVIWADIVTEKMEY
jgi:hypothetical protein